jgi:vacuolar-type H+-ATPase subunit I/STV1
LQNKFSKKEIGKIHKSKPQPDYEKAESYYSSIAEMYSSASPPDYSKSIYYYNEAIKVIPEGDSNVAVYKERIKDCETKLEANKERIRQLKSTLTAENAVSSNLEIANFLKKHKEKLLLDDVTIRADGYLGLAKLAKFLGNESEEKEYLSIGERLKKK